MMILGIAHLRSSFLLVVGSFIYSSSSTTAAAAAATALQGNIPYEYYDIFRLNNNNSTQLQAEFAPENSTSNVAKLTLSSSNTATTFRLAHLAVFLPFEGGKEKNFISDSAAILLAVHRFNRNPLDEKYFQCNSDDYIKDDGTKEEGDPCAQARERQKNCNVRLTTEFFDTNSSEVTGAAKLGAVLERKNGNLSSSRPSAIIGEYRSAITSPLTILAGIEDVPQISGASTSAYLDDQEVYPLFARTIPSSDGEASAIVDYYINLGVHRVSILYLSDAFGSALQRNFEEIASAVGMETAYAGYVGKEDIPSAIQQIKASKYQHVFCIAFQESYETILEEAYKAGIAGGNYAWLFYGPAQYTIQDRSEYRKGSPLYEASKGVAIINFESVPHKAIQYPGRRTPDPLPENPTTATERFMYDWKDVVKDTEFLNYLRAKLPVDTVVHDVNSILEENLDVYGYFFYDAITAMAIAMCQTEVEFFTGPDVIAQFNTIRFEGISGHVRFNEVNTRNHTTTRFTVWNLVPAGDDEAIKNDNGDVLHRFYLSPTAMYASGKWEEIRPFVYADGRLVPPADLIPVESTVDDVNDTTRYVGLAMSFAVIAFFLYCMVWTLWLGRSEPVVQASQPSFLMLVAFGSLIQSASIIPMSYDHGQNDTTNKHAGDAACMAVPWLFYMGLSFTCAGLYCKVRRLYEVFCFPDLDRLLVEKGDFIFWSCLVAGMNAIVLSIWTAMSPLKYDIVADGSTDVFGRSTSSHGICQSEENEDLNPFWLSIFLVNVCTLLISNWFTYKARAIETEYQESQFVAFALGTIIESLVIGSAMQHATRDTPDANYVITIGTIFLTSFVVAALIFVPKMMALRKERREKKARSNAKKPDRRHKGPRIFNHDDKSESDGDPGSGDFAAVEESPEALYPVVHITGLKVLHHPGANAAMMNPYSGTGSRGGSGVSKTNQDGSAPISGPIPTAAALPAPPTNDGKDCSETNNDGKDCSETNNDGKDCSETNNDGKDCSETNKDGKDLNETNNDGKDCSKTKNGMDCSETYSGKDCNER